MNPLAGSAAILCIGGLDVIRKEAWPFYRIISGVRLYWVLEEPKGPNDKHLHGFSAEPVSVSAYVGSSKNLKDLKDVCRKTW